MLSVHLKLIQNNIEHQLQLEKNQKHWGMLIYTLMKNFVPVKGILLIRE